MTRGRKTKPWIDELRSGFWYWALKEAATHEARKKLGDPDLAQFLGNKLSPDDKVLANPKQLGRYRRGEKNPSKQTLECVEQLYPGTRMFFENGPWFSYLWMALDPSHDPQDTITALETTWRNGVHLEHEIPLGGEGGIQDLLVPQELASRWRVKSGARLDLTEKCQPWERLNDVCAQLIPPGPFETYTAGAVLTLAPSATFTKEERVEASPKVRLPFFAGVGYRIAQARIKGENTLTLNSAAEPRNTNFGGRLLKQLLLKLPDATGFEIIIQEEACFVVSSCRD
jgi:hypothetical protein